MPLLARGMVRVACFCLAWALLSFAAPAWSGESALAPLTIDTASGAHQFQVEVAADDPSREQGLMFRRSLAPDHGMLFDFGAARAVAMWMKNTFIPLDMVFILPSGVVHRVEERTDPFSEKVIEAGADVRFVLEVPAGTAVRIGLKRGDHVRAAQIGAP